MKQNRFQSKIVWAAIIAQLISLGQLTGLFAKWGLDAGQVGNIAAGILQLFVIVGFINDPTSKETW